MEYQCESPILLQK